MSKMGTTDIVIHKGEKDTKYQLYVEDYVISYLKNYGAEDNGSIFFYGKRELSSKTYRVYGAGRQSGLAFFAEYDFLDEITCRVTMDMPVFYMREPSGTYELSGFYIFYQNNEAMQSYMIERRKEIEAKEKAKDGGKQKKAPIHQGMPEINKRTSSEIRSAPKERNGLLGVQLTAVFVVLIAIVINSTNSFDKLRELTQAAVEVFFTIENQEAAIEKSGNENETEQGSVAAETDVAGEESIEVDAQSEGTILRLEDIDARFEEENQAAKNEEAGTDGEMENRASVTDTAENDAAQTAAAEEDALNGNDTAPGEDVSDGKDMVFGEDALDGKDTVIGEDVSSEKDMASIEEVSPSKQAFARNFAEYYQIEKGDTLYAISIKIYGDTSKVKEICELNQITDPDNIKYGQKILLP